MATSAYELDLDVMQGRIVRTENGWTIGGQDLDAWLERHQGEQFVAILGSLTDERPVRAQSCRKCGRDYTDIECPHCTRNRKRMRGR